MPIVTRTKASGTVMNVALTNVLSFDLKTTQEMYPINKINRMCSTGGNHTYIITSTGIKNITIPLIKLWKRKSTRKVTFNKIKLNPAKEMAGTIYRKSMFLKLICTILFYSTI